MRLRHRQRLLANTTDLRALQGPDNFDHLIAALATERDALAKRYGNRVPLAVKIAPDMNDAGIEMIADRVARAASMPSSRPTPPYPRWIEHLPASASAAAFPVRR